MGYADNARTFSTIALVKSTGTGTPATFQIGTSGAGHLAPSGTLIYGCYGFNKILTNTELSSVIDVLNSRHARTYA